MKVLFLDVDGVLNNRSTQGRGGGVAGFSLASVNALRRVLEATGAKVVVSSTWRHRYSLAEFNQHVLAFSGIPPVAIGKTRKSNDMLVHSVWRPEPRGRQIGDWLAEHEEVTEWAAVDDDTSIDVEPERLVQTSFEVDGLTEAHADRLIEILGAEQ